MPTNLGSYFTVGNTRGYSGSSSSAGGGSLGGTYTDYSDAYGGKATVPDPTSTAKTAISGDLSNLGSLYDLASSINSFNTGQTQAQYASGLPNYANMLKQSSSNISSLLSGQLPDDVVQQLSQNAAERGISTGLSGSANQNTALLRALGLTSLGLESTGESELTAAIGRTPTTKIFDTASYLTTPEAQQQAQLYANIYGSAAVPSAAAGAAQSAASSGVAAGRAAAGSAPSMGGSSSGGGTGPGAHGYGGGGAGTISGTGVPIGNVPATDQGYQNWNNWNQSMPWNKTGTGSGSATDAEMQDWLTGGGLLDDSGGTGGTGSGAATDDEMTAWLTGEGG